jgi:hypothetical protein
MAVDAVLAKQIRYSGPMMLAMEDKRLAQRRDENTYGIDSLLAYSTVWDRTRNGAVPGDRSAGRMAQIYEAAAALV